MDRRRPVAASAALLVLCALFDGATAAALAARQQPQPLAQPTPGSSPTHLATTTATAEPTALTTLPYHILNVVPWPPLPTDTSPLLDTNAELRRRQLLAGRDTNTVCGYIGGNPDLPATCSAGSHCVLDAEHSAVGCCPNGVASCTAGVFTGCVDATAATVATAVNPYVYTCSAGSYCYKNAFPGGYYQYGCGSASTLGQSVAATATGDEAAQVVLSSVRVTFTGTYTATSTTSAKSTKTKASTKSTSSSTSESTSSSPSSSESSSSSPSSSSSTSSESSTPSSSSTASPANTENNTNHSSDRTGIIVGATISAVAGVIAIISLIIFCMWKRRRRNGAKNGSSFNPRGSPPGFRGPNSGSFQALHSTPEDFESGLHPAMAGAHAEKTGTFTQISAGGANNTYSDMSPPPKLRAWGRPRPVPPPVGEYHSLYGNEDASSDAWATPAIVPDVAAAAAAGAAAGTAFAAEVAPAIPVRRDGGVLSRKPLSQRSNHRGVAYEPQAAEAAAAAAATASGSLSRQTSSAAASEGGRPLPPSAAYHQLSPYGAGMSGLSGVASPPLVASAAQRPRPYANEIDDDHLDADQVPLTGAFYDDFSRGYHQDVLSRIGEEDDADFNISGASVGGLRGTDSRGSSNTRGNASLGTSTSGTARDSSGALPLSSHPVNLRGGGALSPDVSSPSLSMDNDDTPAPLFSGGALSPPSAGTLEGRPLWQQNRQKGRNLMWS